MELLILFSLAIFMCFFFNSISHFINFFFFLLACIFFFLIVLLDFKFPSLVFTMVYIGGIVVVFLFLIWINGIRMRNIQKGVFSDNFFFIFVFFFLFTIFFSFFFYLNYCPSLANNTFFHLFFNKVEICTNDFLVDNIYDDHIQCFSLGLFTFINSLGLDKNVSFFSSFKIILIKIKSYISIPAITLFLNSVWEFVMSPKILFILFFISFILKLFHLYGPEVSWINDYISSFFTSKNSESTNVVDNNNLLDKPEDKIIKIDKPEEGTEDPYDIDNDSVKKITEKTFKEISSPKKISFYDTTNILEERWQQKQEEEARRKEQERLKELSTSPYRADPVEMEAAKAKFVNEARQQAAIIEQREELNAINACNRVDKKLSSHVVDGEITLDEAVEIREIEVQAILKRRNDTIKESKRDLERAAQDKYKKWTTQKIIENVQNDYAARTPTPIDWIYDLYFPNRNKPRTGPINPSNFSNSSSSSNISNIDRINRLNNRSLNEMANLAARARRQQRERKMANSDS